VDFDATLVQRAASHARISFAAKKNSARSASASAIDTTIIPREFPASLFPGSFKSEQPRTLARRPSVLMGRKENSWRRKMLWTIFVILLVLWLLGVVSSYTLGGFIHILLVIALVVLLIQLITGRRAV
jgi:hypothetical protein